MTSVRNSGVPPGSLRWRVGMTTIFLALALGALVLAQNDRAHGAEFDRDKPCFARAGSLFCVALVIALMEIAEAPAAERGAAAAVAWINPALAGWCVGQLNFFDPPSPFWENLRNHAVRIFFPTKSAWEKS